VRCDSILEPIDEPEGPRQTDMTLSHPVFWLMLVAVTAPMLAEIPIGVRVPVVVIEVLLGIVIGPHVLDLVQFDGLVEEMFRFAMAATLFMAGMELDFGQVRGRPLALAAGGWVISLVLGLVAVGVLHAVPEVNAPMMVTLALCTTGLGVLMPIFRDGGHLQTAFGRLAVAAGTMGEVAPIVAMSLLLSQRYSTWQELGFLLAFLAIVGVTAAIGMSARPPVILAFLSRHMHASTQLPVRIALLMMAGLFVLAEQFGFESIFGTFAAGMIVGQATRGADGKPFRDKIEAVTFGWFYPFFFVGTGIHFNVPALVADLDTMLLLPTFLLLFLVVRGLPVLLLYRNAIARMERWPLALSSAVPSLSVIVVISEIGLKAKTISHDVAAALLGAALLAVLLFPTIAGALLPAKAPRTPGAD
jgi:Kef-type K+ transport system membrane component KefB